MIFNFDALVYISDLPRWYDVGYRVVYTCRWILHNCGWKNSMGNISRLLDGFEDIALTHLFLWVNKNNYLDMYFEAIWSTTSTVGATPELFVLRKWGGG